MWAVCDTGTPAAQTHVDMPSLPMPVVPDPKPQCWTPQVKPSSQVPLLLGDHVAPTVRGEVVGHVFTQAHSPGALLELVRNGIADLAAPSCVGRETPPSASQPCLSLPLLPGPPTAGLGAKGIFSSEKTATKPCRYESCFCWHAGENLRFPGVK